MISEANFEIKFHQKKLILNKIMFHLQKWLISIFV